MKFASWGDNIVEIIKDRSGQSRVKVKVISGGLAGTTLLVERSALTVVDMPLALVNKAPSPVYHLSSPTPELEDGKLVSSPGPRTACGLKITSSWKTLLEPRGTLCLRCRRESN